MTLLRLLWSRGDASDTAVMLAGMAMVGAWLIGLGAGR